MHEDTYGIVWEDDDPDLEASGAEEPETAAPVEPAVDEPTGVVYTRGPNGRLIQSS